MRKIKVLIISGDMHVGGIQNQLMHLLRNSDKEDFQIDFTSTMPDAFYREEIEKLGAKFWLIPEMRIRNPFPYCKAIYRIMKTGKYDIIHSHELFHSGIVLAVARLAGIKSRIVHAHNGEDRDDPEKPRGFVRNIYNWGMRGAIGFFSTSQIACSTWAAEFLYGKNRAYSETCHLVYNSVDTTKFLEHYSDRENGEFCDEWKNIIHVGRITPVKNQLFLIQIAENLKKRNKKIRILCAGNGEAAYVNQLEALIEERELQEYILLIGVRKDIDSLMRKSCVFVLPSKFEGMPLVLIEAQASGLPCVVADTFSHEVDFGLGQIQWMSLKQSVDEWTDVLEKMAERDRIDKEYIEKAIQEKGFDSRIFAKKILDIYRKEFEKRYRVD